MSRRFYAGWGEWRYDYRQALSFPELSPAVSRIAVDHVEDAEVVIIEQGGVEITFTAGRRTESLPIGS